MAEGVFEVVYYGIDRKFRGDTPPGRRTLPKIYIGVQIFYLRNYYFEKKILNLKVVLMKISNDLLKWSYSYET